VSGAADEAAGPGVWGDAVGNYRYSREVTPHV